MSNLGIGGEHFEPATGRLMDHAEIFFFFFFLFSFPFFVGTTTDCCGSRRFCSTEGAFCKMMMGELMMIDFDYTPLHHTSTYQSF
jgi:hypothetical protein